MLFSIVVLIMSVVVHEVAHGYVASLLGDQTARYAGRLTLNPIKHLDPIGSVIVPLITSMGGFIFGWAKPVPVNPYNLRPQRWGEFWVAAAGPLSNIVLALAFSAVIRFGGSTLPESFVAICSSIVLINLVLAFFNLVPIPPLDGSKVLFSLLPIHLGKIRDFLERYSLFLVLIFILFLWRLFLPLILWVFVLLIGG